MPDSPTAGHHRFSELMRAAQNGDSAAYATLLGDLAPLVRRVVWSRRSFLAEADVEDVVQEVLISVHSVRATYDPRRPFLPWLLAITRHRLLDAMRRHRRSVGREVGLDDPDVTFGEVGANPEAEELGDAEALRQAVADLPPGQRQAITLLKLQGMSLREAAATTGMSAGALKVATHRAMVALRRKLTGD